MNTSVLSAIFRRNFVAYFSTPTGYAFIFVFILVSQISAFSPHEFFNSNLANLDQLNRSFPFIMLVFIPAITMGIWADERRQGTDELLLTVPATDFDVVIGKYLAAVAIYSVALLFSLAANLVLLMLMGDPDLGLFFANYCGYWFVGLAMLAIGMVGSFLTGNLTVAFIIGVVLNAPLVMVASADVVVTRTALVPSFSRWSIGHQLNDFGRGAISFSSTVYFVTIAFTMLYLCMVLIGRRHWLGGRDGHAMLGHYVLRALALGVASVGAVVVFASHDVRVDATSNRINTLTPETKDLLRTLNADEVKQLEVDRKDLLAQREKVQDAKDAKDGDAKKTREKLDRALAELDRKQQRLSEPVRIEAYVSRDVPEAYVAKRTDLLSKLTEFENLAGHGRLHVTIHDVDDVYGDEATAAKDRYGIESRAVEFRTHGARTQNKMFLGAAFIRGTNRDVVKFFELGIPVEYELIRSIAAVAQENRKTLGAIVTMADLRSSFGPREQGLLGELEKQYKVDFINPASKIELEETTDGVKRSKYAALLLIQPSSLGPQEMDHVVEAVNTGVPTAIFEDPFPAMLGGEVPGTNQPRRPPRNPMMMFQPPQDLPKGDIQKLWSVLGVKMAGREYRQDEESENPLARIRGRGTKQFESHLIWQKNNPYRQLRLARTMTNEWIFIRDAGSSDAARIDRPFAVDDPVTANLFELLFPYPGALEKQGSSQSEPSFVPLVRTNEQSGVVRYKEVMDVYETYQGRSSVTGERPDMIELPFEMRSREESQPQRYVLAARIKGKTSPKVTLGGDGTDPTKAKDLPPGTVNAIVVMDIDMLSGPFFRVRADPDVETGMEYQFQNVPFLLNVVDSLAGDNRFLAVRNRRQRYGTLTRFEERAENIRLKVEEIIEKAATEYNKTNEDATEAYKTAEKTWQEKMAKIEGSENPNLSEILDARYKRNLEIAKKAVESDLAKRTARVDRTKKLAKAEEDRERDTRRLEANYKMLAVLLPPLPPLCLALVVYGFRRAREREGVAKSRLR